MIRNQEIVSFAALNHTIKDNQELASLIYNIPTANDGEQHKDNNIIKYLESNKDRILAFTEKNYDNLTEALTNNVVGSAATTSLSNLTLSLRQASTFFSLSYQIDTSKIEESEIYPNNKGDTAD